MDAGTAKFFPRLYIIEHEDASQKTIECPKCKRIGKEWEFKDGLFSAKPICKCPQCGAKHTMRTQHENENHVIFTLLKIIEKEEKESHTINERQRYGARHSKNEIQKLNSRQCQADTQMEGSSQYSYDHQNNRMIQNFVVPHDVNVSQREDEFRHIPANHRTVENQSLYMNQRTGEHHRSIDENQKKNENHRDSMKKRRGIHEQIPLFKSSQEEEK